MPPPQAASVARWRGQRPAAPPPQAVSKRIMSPTRNCNQRKKMASTSKNPSPSEVLRGFGGSRPPTSGGTGAAGPRRARKWTPVETGVWGREPPPRASADTRHTAGGAEPKRGTAEERRARGDSGPPKGGPADRDDPKGEARKARGRAGQPARGPAPGGQGGPEGGAQSRRRGRAGGRGEGGKQPPEGATPRTRDRAPTRGGRRPTGPWPEDASPPKWGRGSGKPQATGEQQRNSVQGNLVSNYALSYGDRMAGSP